MENRIEYGTLNLNNLFGNLEAPDLCNRDNHSKLAGYDAPDFSLAYLGPQILPNAAESKDFNLRPINLDDFLDESVLNEGLDDISGVLNDEGLNQNAETLNLREKIAEASTVSIQEPTLDDFYMSSFVNNSQPDLSEKLQLPKINENKEYQHNFQYIPIVTDVFISTSLAQTDTSDQLFDPRKRTFTDDDLKPQPIIRKATKMCVPADRKDARYWHKREKNNVAAKRSREARRIKENQIVMRTKFLEEENDSLRDEVQYLRAEVSRLMMTVDTYTRSPREREVSIRKLF